MTPPTTAPIASITTREDFNPRTDFNMESIERLAASIKEHGILTPLRVRPNGSGDTYYLIAGERRFIAAGLAGLDEVPIVLEERFSGDGVSADELAQAFIENVHREDLNPVDVAMTIAKLKELGYTNRKTLAAKLGLSDSVIKSRMEILDLTDDLKDLVRSGDLPLKDVTHIAPIAQKSPELANALADVIAEAKEDAAGDRWAEPWEWSDLRDDRDNFQRRGLIAEALEKIDALVPCPIPHRIYVPREAEGLDPEIVAAVATYEETFSSPPVIALDDHDLDAAKAYGCLAHIGDIALITDEKFLIDRINLHKTSIIERAESKGTPVEDEPKGAAPPIDPETNKPAESADRAKEIRKAEREQAAREREEARAFNHDLAKQVFERIHSVQLDKSLADLLITLAIQDDGVEWALRGLRYLHPAWTETVKTESGKEKEQLVSTKEDARKRLASFLEAPTAEAKLAKFCQLLIASYAADQRVVARSNRTGSQPRAHQYAPDGADAKITAGRDRLLKLLTPAMAKRVTERNAERDADSVGVGIYDD